MDRLSRSRRSWNMSRIRSKDTKPELFVRSTLHRLGYRFRLHKKGLPGRPDIVLKKHNTVIFVHGCFWHRHSNCKEASRPKTNSQFWENKIKRNIERDRNRLKQLKELGWNVVIIWECELKNDFSHNKGVVLDRFKNLV